MMAVSMLVSQVALRIRPLSDIEIEEGAVIVAHRVDDQVRVWHVLALTPPILNLYICLYDLNTCYLFLVATEQMKIQSLEMAFLFGVCWCSLTRESK